MLSLLKMYSRDNVPWVLTCSRVNVPWVLRCLRGNMSCVLCANVPTCISCLRAHVPICLERLRACPITMHCMLMYLLVNVPCELKRSRSNMSWVLSLTWLAWKRNHLATCLVFLVSSFDATFPVLLPLLLKLYTLLVKFDIWLMFSFNIIDVNSDIIQGY